MPQTVNRDRLALPNSALNRHEASYHRSHGFSYCYCYCYNHSHVAYHPHGDFNDHSHHHP